MCMDSTAKTNTNFMGGCSVLSKLFTKSAPINFMKALHHFDGEGLFLFKAIGDRRIFKRIIQRQLLPNVSAQLSCGTFYPTGLHSTALYLYQNKTKLKNR